ncbi:hypothetical protein ACOAKC_08970 [Hathewaya histolytica]|uniref:hypothetical protein n=1 Tax=Hathewaya histolytica TaxID=1498 RepID=UPI003B672131
MERLSKEIADRRLNERLRAEVRSKKNSFINKVIKEVKGKSKKLVGRTFKFVKGNKVTIATSVVAAGAGLAKGGTKKNLHFLNK